MCHKYLATFLISFALTLSLSLRSAISAKTIKFQNSPEYQAIIGFENLRDFYYNPHSPWSVVLSPGDTIGWIVYDYQTNGSTGRRIAVDSDRGAHAFWYGMESYPGEGGIYYNYRDLYGNWYWPEGILVFPDAGHPQVDIDSNDGICVAFHSLENYVEFCRLNPQTGETVCFDPPDMLDYRCFWPFLTVDHNDNIHIVIVENSQESGRTLGYTRSTDGGQSWTEAQRVDTITTISQIVVSSPVSDKVSIVYAHPTDLDNQWMNDVYFLESEDGLTWDWRSGKVNITEYGRDGDSLYAYTDLDAIYDFNDNLHIVWNAQWVTDEAVYVKTSLFHWAEDIGAIELTSSDSVWVEGCDFGAWNRPICKMSLSISESTNWMVIAYTNFDTSDCSAGGYANGEIYMQYSIDRGENWSPPMNTTNSSTPGCVPGDCESDHWSSLADRLESDWPYPDPYLIFINDRDAGAIPHDEGSVTNNPVMFMDRIQTGVKDEKIIPEDFLILGIYPNPFNAQTTIKFTLAEQSYIKLEIYDIIGRLVEILADTGYPAGENSIVWNAEDQSSGVYFARLSSSSGNSAKKLILLK